MVMMMIMNLWCWWRWCQKVYFIKNTGVGEDDDNHVLDDYVNDVDDYRDDDDDGDDDDEDDVKMLSSLITEIVMMIMSTMAM